MGEIPEGSDMKAPRGVNVLLESFLFGRTCIEDRVDNFNRRSNNKKGGEL